MNLSKTDIDRVRRDYDVLFYTDGDYGVLVESSICINGIETIISGNEDIFTIAKRAKLLIESNQYAKLLDILGSPDWDSLTESKQQLLLNTVIIDKIFMDELDEAEDMNIDLVC